jgi:hypothetical protein
MVNFLKKVPAIVQSGSVKSNPLKLWDGGLDGMKDGLKYMMDGKVSGQKLVYRV